MAFDQRIGFGVPLLGNDRRKDQAGGFNVLGIDAEFFNTAIDAVVACAISAVASAAVLFSLTTPRLNVAISGLTSMKARPEAVIWGMGDFWPASCAKAGAQETAKATQAATRDFFIGPIKN